MLPEFGCTSLALPPTDNPADGQSAIPGLSSFLDKVDLVAGLVHDGYVLPGNETSSDAKLVQEMLHYRRHLHARREGMLPVDSLPFCFLALYSCKA